MFLGVHVEHQVLYVAGMVVIACVLPNVFRGVSFLIFQPVILLSLMA